MVRVELFNHQKEAVSKMKNGSILCGGVGTGKSLTAVAYWEKNEKPKDLYIITTAKKRDSLEWEGECAPFLVKPVVDSWNNIGKYQEVKGAFFIFDEQRLVGSGTWVKKFLRIAKWNNWILLSATPGDTWTDYLPVFMANKFYRTRTEFLRRHAVYSRFSKYPKIDYFIETNRLLRLRDEITVIMEFKKKTNPIFETITVGYDRKLYDETMKNRWDPFKNEPIKSAGELCYTLRKIVNMNYERIEALDDIYKRHGRIIVFYNFDYELNMLRAYADSRSILYAEWNGHKHMSFPRTVEGTPWLYFVQYTAGAEGWNCVECDCTFFFSQNFSYKIMVQAAGRIDRLNTPYTDLYYYNIVTNSKIDDSIKRAIKNKKMFNMQKFYDENSRQEHML